MSHTGESPATVLLPESAHLHVRSKPAPVDRRGFPTDEANEFHPDGGHHAEVAARDKVDDRQEIYDAYSPGGSPKIDWVVFAWIVGMHIGALAAPWFFTWSALGVTILLHWLTCSIGICLMYHRCLSHRSLKLAPPVHFFATLCGVLSGEGKPLTWTAVHRLHHSRSDKAGDPHSPLDGPWWSHLYWMFHEINLDTKDKMYRRYTPDLLNDKTVMFFEKTYGWWLFGSGGVLFLIGGWPFLIWGLCVRMVFHSPLGLSQL
jgi:stearoyl-CoA desaturase (delta-9 desaturase)